MWTRTRLAGEGSMRRGKLPKAAQGASPCRSLRTQSRSELPESICRGKQRQEVAYRAGWGLHFPSWLSSEALAERTEPFAGSLSAPLSVAVVTCWLSPMPAGPPPRWSSGVRFYPTTSASSGPSEYLCKRQNNPISSEMLAWIWSSRQKEKFRSKEINF